MYVEKIVNVYISLYSSVWNKRLDDNIYSMLTCDPGLEIHCTSYYCMSELKWFDLLLLFCNYKWWRYTSTVFSSDSREPFCEETIRMWCVIIRAIHNLSCPHFAIFIKFEDRFVKMWPPDGCSSDLDGGETNRQTVCLFVSPPPRLKLNLN